MILYSAISRTYLLLVFYVQGTVSGTVDKAVNREIFSFPGMYCALGVDRLNAHITMCLLGMSTGKKMKKKKGSQTLVFHAFNPSYSGGRDQEDRSVKPGRAK
jgi:hypothetical protein